MELVTLQSCRDDLLKLNTTACGFFHEFDDKPMPNFCPPDVRNNRLGCPHSGIANMTMVSIIAILEESKILTSDEAVNYRTQLETAGRQLLKLDSQAASDGMYEIDSHASFVEKQTPPISMKSRVRDSLLQVIERAIQPHAES